MLYTLLLLLVLQVFGDTPPCQASLEARAQDGMLTVTGRCRSLIFTAAHYRYEMSLTRIGAGGSSQNVQRGAFDLAPQQDVSLSQSTVNISPQDTYQIHLRVLDLTGHILAEDSATQALTR